MDKQLIHDLARSIAHPSIPERHLRELMAGIEVERKRLGSRPFLLVLNQKSYDYDSMVEFILLAESFGELPSATEAAIELLQARIDKLSADRWRLEPQGERPYPDKPSRCAMRHTGLRVTFSRTVKMRGPSYEGGHPSFDVEYICARVIEGFTGPNVSKELFEILGQNPELVSFFSRCAEAIRTNGPRPTLDQYY